ncbi:MAG: tetratricopeptide repeat protein, partial [Opitutaceae bacterium]|nr:tetratricopeptide repeat protein [Verrucomicrobiales bacterium]
MNQTWSILQVIGSVLVLAGIGGWVLYRSLKQSDEPVRLIYRLVITLVLIVVGGGLAIGSGHFAPVIVLPFAVTVGLLWAPSWGSMLASPLTSMFDGGQEVADPGPMYSVAQSLRMKDRYVEAAAELRKQLERYPHDYALQMMLAEIQVENLGNFSGARAIIESILSQPDHRPANLADALNQLADWHLKFASDSGEARLALERIQLLFPDSPFAMMAAQRIARFESADKASEARHRAPLVMGLYEKEIGLRKIPLRLGPEDPDPETLIANCQLQLEKHPLDSATREQLALLYLEHYHQMDLAEREMETLIANTSFSLRERVRWLNLLATWQIAHGAHEEAARRTLHRILEMSPRGAMAEV